MRENNIINGETYNFDSINIVEEDEIRKWIIEYQNSTGTDNRKLKEKIFNQYARYVLRMAKHYANGLRTPVFDYNDVFIEGYLAFERALETFDPNAGYKFLTYAGHWICRYMNRFSSMNAWEIYIPAGLSADLKRAMAIRYKITGRNETYSKESLIEELGVSERVAETLYKLSVGTTKSLNSTLEINNDCELIEFVRDESIDVSKKIIQEDMTENMVALISKVCKKSRDEEIIKMRYGFPPYDRTHTLAEIGDKFGISRERVRQLEKSTLTKIKNLIGDKVEDFICE